MSNYNKITDYAAKDLLLTGDAAKAIKGTEVGAEFDAIATMSATKVDSGGALGTPSSGTLTNCTELPVSTGISGLGTGVATALAVNIGSAGAAVTNGGALGTPSSGTLTNCTGLPLAGVTDSTTEALGVGSLEVGHASDTTITRVSAGTIAVEGVNVYTTATGAALAGSASQNFATNALTASGGVQSISASALIGYGTGAGGTVTQTTSKSTAVTLNRPNGTIITTADALGAGATVRPNLINSTILSTSRIHLFLRTAGAVGAVYNVWVDGLADGVATIAIKNISGTSYSESIEIGFIVFGGSNS